jgi:hypothetical protein
VEEERNRESESSSSGMGAVSELEMLQARAQLMRESLGKEWTISILGSFDHRLSTLESAMCPTQVLLWPILISATIIEHQYLDNYFCRTIPICMHLAQQFLERQS